MIQHATYTNLHYRISWGCSFAERCRCARAPCCLPWGTWAAQTRDETWASSWASSSCWYPSRSGTTAGGRTTTSATRGAAPTWETSTTGLASRTGRRARWPNHRPLPCRWWANSSLVSLSQLLMHKTKRKGEEEVTVYVCSKTYLKQQPPCFDYSAIYSESNAKNPCALQFFGCAVWNPMVGKVLLSQRVSNWFRLCVKIRAVRSNGFWFNSIFDSKGAETFWFDFDLILIRFNLQFNLIENLLSTPEKKKKKHFNRGNNPPGCQKQLAKSVVTFCRFFTCYCHSYWFFVLKIF